MSSPRRRLIRTKPSYGQMMVETPPQSPFLDRTEKDLWRYLRTPRHETGEYVENEETGIEDVDLKIEETILNPSPLIGKEEQFRFAAENPVAVTREIVKRDLKEFIQYFWSVVSSDALIWNWHMTYICDILMDLARTVSLGKPKKHDVIFNVPPGSTKSLMCSVMFPDWCWTNWPWMRFICASYSRDLSLEQAGFSRDVLRSVQFRQLFPEISIKEDKDTKHNYRIQHIDKEGHRRLGGNRYSTSVGGTLTGFHGHILVVDDPIKPEEAVSELKLNTANRWMSQTLSTRKTDKALTPTILVMQRLHQNDPAGHMLRNEKANIFHVCLPGEIMGYRECVHPPELAENYIDELLDPKRMPRTVLKEMESKLGQYGYAGQIGQNPVPPGGGMFRVDNFARVEDIPTDANIAMTLRYWDKAGSKGKGAYTCGVKMCRLKSNRFIVMNVRRGQWDTDERERIIRQTAEADGNRVIVYHEQEPGSGGKDSAQATIRNLAGFSNYADRPTGDKVFRADPYSVQVNNGNVSLLRGDWNHDFIEEHRFFPFGTYKDQVDAAAGAFTKLTKKREVRQII